jgi:hypothetical protein
MSTKTYTVQLEVCIDAENEEEALESFIDYLSQLSFRAIQSHVEIQETTK